MEIITQQQLLLIFISWMPVVKASLTLSFLCQTQYVGCRKSETIVQCFVCHSISFFKFDLLHDISCAPYIDAKFFQFAKSIFDD